jgi:arylsulfatase
MTSKKGETPKNLEVYDSKRRLTIDGDLTDRSIDFMHRHANKDKPFFLFVPYTQTHVPVEPHPDYKGKTGNGHWADVLAQTDDYVGKLLNTVDQLGIKDNTIFIFTSDNGPEGFEPYHGFSGPWRGSYFTGLEGSLRVPFLMRWPEKVPPALVSNDIVHEMDLFATFARFTGGKIPTDRIIDSVDQSQFLTGKATKSNRESVIIYVGEDIYPYHFNMQFQR